MNKDVKKILIMLAFYALSAGMLYPQQDSETFACHLLSFVLISMIAWLHPFV